MPCRPSTLRYGSAAYCPDSIGRRNTSLTGSQHGVESLGRRSPTERILLADSAQAASAAKREVRVVARGTAWNQAARRSRLIAAAVATCCRRVLASPR